MIVSPAFAGRNYAVLGLARSGLATAAALTASGAKVVAWDDREEVRAEYAANGGRIADPMTSATKQLPQRRRNPPKRPDPKLPNIDDRSSNCQQDISLYTLAPRVSVPAAFSGSGERCWIPRQLPHSSALIGFCGGALRCLGTP